MNKIELLKSLRTNDDYSDLIKDFILIDDAKIGSNMYAVELYYTKDNCYMDVTRLSAVYNINILISFDYKFKIKMAKYTVSNRTGMISPYNQVNFNFCADFGESGLIEELKYYDYNSMIQNNTSMFDINIYDLGIYFVDFLCIQVQDRPSTIQFCNAIELAINNLFKM
jgi:hypothetical protein